MACALLIHDADDPIARMAVRRISNLSGCAMLPMDDQPARVLPRLIVVASVRHGRVARSVRQQMRRLFSDVRLKGRTPVSLVTWPPADGARHAALELAALAGANLDLPVVLTPDELGSQRLAGRLRPWLRSLGSWAPDGGTDDDCDTVPMIYESLGDLG